MGKKKPTIKRSSDKKREDVLRPDPHVRETVIMFTDIVGASEVSNHLEPKEYKDFVNEFQIIFKNVCDEYTDTWFEDHHKCFPDTRGDEGVFMAFSTESTSSLLNIIDTALVDIAVNIALVIKRRWMLTDWNKKKRIRHGILPTDVAIGINVGQTHATEIKDGEKDKHIFEGYAINLAKRVESDSRAGGYTRIFVSESAHAALNRLPDEKIYVFDRPRTIRAKGFSREVRAFEVMHHFLPTDWSDYIKDKERARSKADLNIPEDQDIDILRYASELNPTNIWLAEELIRSMILNTSAKIDKDKSDDPEYLEDIYAKPIEKLKYLSEGEQRDFGILLIQGLMDGECLRFSRERERYREAKNFRSQSPLLNWYLGYSYSNEVYFRIGGYSCESEEEEKKIGLMQLNDLDDD